MGVVRRARGRLGGPAHGTAVPDGAHVALVVSSLGLGLVASQVGSPRLTGSAAGVAAGSLADRRACRSAGPSRCFVGVAESLDAVRTFTAFRDPRPRGRPGPHCWRSSGSVPPSHWARPIATGRSSRIGPVRGDARTGLDRGPSRVRLADYQALRLADRRGRVAAARTRRSRRAPCTGCRGAIGSPWPSSPRSHSRGPTRPTRPRRWSGRFRGRHT